jgi:hypothetical protein
MVKNRNKQKVVKRLADKSWRRNLKFKEKKRKKRIFFLSVNSIHKTEINKKVEFKRQLSQYKHIKAPVYFSLAHNTEETLKFIEKIETCFKNRQRVFVDLSKVEKLANGAIVVLLSILVNFKTHGIDFNGNFPDNNEARHALNNSGFFKYIYKNINQSESYSFENEICTHANKKVDSLLSEEIIQKASKHIWGEERRCTGLQRVFLELMQNTNNHASLEKQGDKHWWATISPSQTEKKVSFAFIDYGIGIFESLSNKPAENKFYDAINKLKNVFDFTTNAELLKLLLNGDVHKTVTGKYYRGKGLPGIFNACQTNKISNLIIISNDAIADYSQGIYRKLNGKFSGTFVYWELNENNINLIENRNEN